MKNGFANGGFLGAFVGPMFCGKSEALIRTLNRYKIAQMRVVAFKPDMSRRKEKKNEIAGRDGAHFHAYPISVAAPEAILTYLDEYDVIGIEEIQFFEEDMIHVLEECRAVGKRVYVAGLDLDFRTEPFKIVPHLLAIADEVEKMRAVCMVCHQEAGLTQRMLNGKPAMYDSPLIDVGDSEKYEARCRKCHKIPGKPPIAHLFNGTKSKEEVK